MAATARAPEIARRNHIESDSEEFLVGIIAKLSAENDPRKRSAIFRAAGVSDRKPSVREAACARQTPDISWSTFNKIFGGTTYFERPVCAKVPGYNTAGCFLCASAMRQPFAPTGIGKPGLVLSFPGAALINKFHVLVDPSVDGKKTKLQYCGIYTTVHTPADVQIDEWHSLPRRVSNFPYPCPSIWVTVISQCTRTLLTSLRGTNTVGELHARCTLRKRKRSEPTPTEIREWCRKYHQGSERMEYLAIPNSFDSGREVCCWSCSTLEFVALTAGSTLRNLVSN